MEHKNLQPWLDYFEMLQSYEQNGYMEVMPFKHEAYITLPAILALTPGDTPQEQMNDERLLNTLVHIRTYAGFKAQEGVDYLSKTFAFHVVKDEAPHELLYTILLTKRHSKEILVRQSKEKIEVIEYTIK